MVHNMDSIHIHVQKLGLLKDNLPEQAYEPSNQQQNPILLKAKLSLDFWNLWTFDTENDFLIWHFKFHLKSVSIRFQFILEGLTCLQPASLTLMATHLLNSSWKASTLSGLTVNSTQSLNQCSEKSKVMRVNYILYVINLPGRRHNLCGIS